MGQRSHRLSRYDPRDHLLHERAQQLADIAASGDEDNKECARADLFHEDAKPHK